MFAKASQDLEHARNASMDDIFFFNVVLRDACEKVLTFLSSRPHALYWESSIALRDVIELFKVKPKWT